MSSDLTSYPQDGLASRYSGKLLLRDEFDLDDTAFQVAIDRKMLVPISPFLNTLLGKQCRRCGNKAPSLIGLLPCSVCQTEHSYCRKCIEMGRVMACESLYIWNGSEPEWTAHADPCTWQGDLTSAQHKAAEMVTTAVRTRAQELLVWAVCGAGKTEMLYPGITEALKQGMRICIATPRTDVVRELKPRIQEAFSNINIHALYGGSPDLGADTSAQFILATTHQLLRYHKAFDVMIIDEIDAFPYHADPSLPFAAERAKKASCTTIYLTATPRKEQQRLMNRHKLPHVFVPIRYHGYPLPVPTMQMTFSLQKDLRHHHVPKTCVTWMMMRDNPRRQILIFVPTIALAEELKESFTIQSLKEKWIDHSSQVDAVHAEDPERTHKVQRFRQYDLKILITTTILERGVTFPSVDVAVLDAGHDVFDEAALVQIAGRAGRSTEDPTGEVMFFHDGKTDAMIRAIKQIKAMNKRGGV